MRSPGSAAIESGTVSIAGRELSHADARAALDAGIGHIPEDRQRRGLVLEFSIAENIALHDYAKPPDRARRLALPAPDGRAGAKRLIREFDVRGGGPFTRAGGLSGGNQQKVVAAREIDRDPKVLIAAQPTRGLDVGAIEYLHRRLVTERDEGRAILLVSLELDEILSLSDRILVMYEGEIVGEHTGEVSEEADRSRDARRTRDGGRMTALGACPASSSSRPRPARSPGAWLSSSAPAASPSPSRPSCSRSSWGASSSRRRSTVSTRR